MLTPWDMFVIQTVIERYRRRFRTGPFRPPQSPWRGTPIGGELNRGQVTAWARGLRSRTSMTIRVWWHKIVLPSGSHSST
jgi:hypothetical protein